MYNYNRKLFLTKKQQNTGMKIYSRINFQ